MPLPSNNRSDAAARPPVGGARLLPALKTLLRPPCDAR